MQPIQYIYVNVCMYVYIYIYILGILENWVKNYWVLRMPNMNGFKLY